MGGLEQFLHYIDKVLNNQTHPLNGDCKIKCVSQKNSLHTFAFIDKCATIKEKTKKNEQNGKEKRKHTRRKTRKGDNRAI